MKIFAICALICLANGANIQRVARNTEAIIPTIVEEILKVELQSDLKKNSAVEAVDPAPIIKTIKEEIIVEPVASQVIAQEVTSIEEKKPEILEVAETQGIRKVDFLADIAEIVETPEKPVENVEPASSDLRKEPVAEIVIAEIVQPMVRNVIKEEIVQIESLRNGAPEENAAIKEVIPEPVASSNIVEPVVEIVPQVKTVVGEPVAHTVDEVNAEVPAPAPVVPDFKAIPDEKPMTEEKIVKVEVVSEEKVEDPELKLTPVVPKIEEEKIEAPAVEVKKVPEEIAPAIEIKEESNANKLTIAEAPAVEETDADTRQERPTIVQQLQQAVANVPIVGQIFNRNPEIAADEAAAVADESATTAPAGPLQQFIAGAQQAAANVQQALTNTFNTLNPAASNAASAEGSDTTARPQGPVVQAIQTAFQNVANIINPNRDATTSAPASVEKPVKEEGEKPLKTDEAVKSAVVAGEEVAAPEVVQSEESKTQDTAEKKEN